MSVAGAGFDALAEISLAFDGAAFGAATADDAGGFSATLTIPATATPGDHTISASDGRGGVAQAAFLVRASWAQMHANSMRTGEQTAENVLSPASVEGSLAVAWTKNYWTNPIQQFIS